MCVQIDFQTFGMFHANRAPILHQDQHYHQTDRTELPLEPLHLGVQTGALKMVSQTMLHYVQTLHLSCTETNIVSKQTEARFRMTHVPSIWYVPSISYDTCSKISSFASRLFSKHLVCSIQTMHLSCIKISTISKQTEPSNHLSPFTQEYQQVRPKWFLIL